MNKLYINLLIINLIITIFKIINLLIYRAVARILYLWGAQRKSEGAILENLKYNFT